jgi:hypothetical protein
MPVRDAFSYNSCPALPDNLRKALTCLAMKSIVSRLAEICACIIYTSPRVKLGARAASIASTGRTLPLRAQRECQATSESITDAHSASKDGRSRRGDTGASPPTPSEASGVAGVAGEGRPSAAFPNVSSPERRQHIRQRGLA